MENTHTHTQQQQTRGKKVIHYNDSHEIKWPVLVISMIQNRLKWRFGSFKIISAGTEWSTPDYRVHFFFNFSLTLWHIKNYGHFKASLFRLKSTEQLSNICIFIIRRAAAEAIGTELQGIAIAYLDFVEPHFQHRAELSSMSSVFVCSHTRTNFPFTSLKL